MNYFSIITPTYNRANLLPQLYQSIKAQTEKSFEWIVVDDGSIDNTKEVIENFIDEGIIKITYLQQHNQGKHIAVNYGVKEAKGKFVIIIDSDDYFENEQSLQIARNIAEEIESVSEIGGFTGIRFSENAKIDFTKYGQKKWLDGSPYQWEQHGEMQYIYKTEIAKKFPFPIFEGEKYCQESLIHRRIRRHGYKIFRTDHILFRGDYQPDGLTDSYNKMIQSSPRYYTLSIKEKIIDAKTTKDKINLAEMYWDVVFKNVKYPFYKFLFGIDSQLTIIAWYRKFKKKINLFS